MVSFRVQFAKKTTSPEFNKIDINQFSVGSLEGVAIGMCFQRLISPGFGVVVFRYSLAQTMALPSSQLGSVMMKLVFSSFFRHIYLDGIKLNLIFKP